MQDRDNLFSECDKFIKQLKDAGFRCRGDFRDNYSPGWKFNHWELKVQQLTRGCPSSLTNDKGVPLFINELSAGLLIIIFHVCVYVYV